MDWLALDCGGGYLKIGLGSAKAVVPNCTALPKKDLRKLVAQDTEVGVSNHSQLVYTRPLERGYLTDFECQADVWERVLGEQGWNIVENYPSLNGVALTEAPFAPFACQQLRDELVFEQFGFRKSVVESAATFTVRANHPGSSDAMCSVIVDLGYSFTTVTPLFGDKPFLPALRRLDVGGKLLTNYLKELVSYRHFNLQDETFVMEDARRKLCYVSLDFAKDLESCKSLRNGNSIWRDYVLPDYHKVHEGYVVERSGEAGEDNQVLRVNSERIAVPELYFNPSDIGLNQAGLSEVISESIKRCPLEAQQMLRENVILTGGNALTVGLLQRVRNELGPQYCVSLSKHDAVQSPIIGACDYSDLNASSNLVTKAEYEERGTQSRW